MKRLWIQHRCLGTGQQMLVFEQKQKSEKKQDDEDATNAIQGNISLLFWREGLVVEGRVVTQDP